MMRVPIFLAACTALVSCFNNKEIGAANDVDPQSIYYDYKIEGEEGKEAVSIMLQYRFGGEEGTTLVLDEPSTVSVDGIPLKTDSARITGAFYELLLPADGFNGTHTILFTDREKKQHKEEFQYNPFGLASELPEKIKNEPFTIRLSGLSAAPAAIRLVITDTAFNTRDVNEEMMVDSGEIIITRRLLSNLKNGPVTLEIYREEEHPVKNGSKEGGRILITYSLKRQFELTD